MMIKLKKYRLWAVIAIVLLLLVGYRFQNGMAPTQSSEKTMIKSGSEITLYATTDLHYLSDQLTDGGEAYEAFIRSGDGKQLLYMDEIMNAFSDEIARDKPDVLIISGDLTNHGEKKSHEDMAKWLAGIEKSGTSVYVIPGNHDILNPYARAFRGDKQVITENVSPKEFTKLYAEFGYDAALSRDEDSLSYLAAPAEDLWLLMLDTSRYDDNPSLGSPRLDGELSKETLQWITECAERAKENNAKLIAVMHHNLMDHSDVIRKGFTLNNNKDVIALFKTLQIQTVFSGHIHVQDIHSEKVADFEVVEIVNNALSVNPHQYGILNYSPSNESLSYRTSVVDVASWAREIGSNDTNLLNFQNYAADYFGRFAYDMAYRELSNLSGYTEDEKIAMAETMRILNIRYFSGTENLNATDVLNSKGYQLWMEAPDSFFKQYVFSILEDKHLEDQEITINY